MDGLTLAERLPDRGPGSRRERDTGSLGIQCIQIQALIGAYGSNRVLQLDTIYIYTVYVCVCVNKLWLHVLVSEVFSLL